MIDITQQPYYAYNEQINHVFEPISSQSDLQFLGFTRLYHNRQRFLICHHHDWANEYYCRQFYKYGLFDKDSRQFQSHFHLWDHLEYDPKGIYEHMKSKFSFGHGLTITQQRETHCDAFVVVSSPSNTMINNFYINQKDLFLQFIEDFNNAFAETLKQLENHTIFIPTNTHNLSPSFHTLSPRQQDCAQLITKGYTTKEIAKLLRVSPRTVEEHLNILKSKFEAKNRTHLAMIIQKYL